jgi:hypothetical protein
MATMSNQKKVNLPMVLTEGGISIDMNEEQSQKASGPKIVPVLAIVNPPVVPNRTLVTLRRGRGRQGT